MAYGERHIFTIKLHMFIFKLVAIDTGQPPHFGKTWGKCTDYKTSAYLSELQFFFHFYKSYLYVSFRFISTFVQYIAQTEPFYHFILFFALKRAGETLSAQPNLPAAIVLPADIVNIVYRTTFSAPITTTFFTLAAPTDYSCTITPPRQYQCST